MTLSLTYEDAPVGYFHGLSVRQVDRRGSRKASQPRQHLFFDPATGRGGLYILGDKPDTPQRLVRAFEEGMGLLAAARAAGCSSHQAAKFLRVLLRERAKRGLGDFPRPRFRHCRTKRLRHQPCRCGDPHFCKGQCRRCYMRTYNAGRRERMRAYNATRPKRKGSGTRRYTPARAAANRKALAKWRAKQRAA